MDMVSYRTFYRRFRPQNFAEIVGQEHIKTALQNALKTNRVAHAYLFVGQRGTGKTTTAKVLAKAINCPNPQGIEPCNKCEICLGINDGSLTDVLEIDAASNRGIDEVRGLRESVKYTPVYAKRKVYIIDEVHMMTTEAFNALLKTLEEPPEHVCFVLATTEVQKIPATILSRCQRYEFHGIDINKVVAYLRNICKINAIKADEAALFLLAEQSGGSMRDALSIMEQSAIASANNITLGIVQSLLGFIGTAIVRELVDILMAKDVSALFLFFAKGSEKSWDEKQLLKELVKYLHDLLVFGAIGDNSKVSLSDSQEEFSKRSGVLSRAVLSNMIQRLQRAEYNLRNTAETKLMLEMILVDICLCDYIIGDEDRVGEALAEVAILREKIDDLEKGHKLATNFSNQMSDSVVLQNQQKDGVELYQVESEEVVSTNNNVRKTLDINEIWQGVLAELAASNRMVHACLMGGALKEIDGKNAIIVAPTEFAKQRADSADYKKIIGSVFKKVSGLDIMPKILLADSKSDLVTKSKRKEVVENKKTLSKAVQQAHEVFGGEIRISDKKQ